MCQHERMSSPAYDPAGTVEALRVSLDALETLLAQVPERWLSVPVIEGDAWGVTMNLAHLAAYERRLAAPVLEEIIAGRDGRAAAPSGDEDWFRRETQELSEQPLREIWSELQVARERQIAAVGSCSSAALNTALTPLWGGGQLQSAGWVAWKTVQHSWEHGTPIMQTALFAPR